MAYKSIKFNDLVAHMNIFRDLETAQYAFHIAKLFSKYQRMQNEIMKRKKEIIEAVMDCIRA